MFDGDSGGEGGLVTRVNKWMDDGGMGRGSGGRMDTGEKEWIGEWTEEQVHRQMGGWVDG